MTTPTLWHRARLRAAGRLAPVAAVLLMLMAPLAGTAQAAPASAVAGPLLTFPGAPADPCEALKNTPSYEYCKAGGAGQDKPQDDPCRHLNGHAYDYCKGTAPSPGNEGGLTCDDIAGPAGEHCNDGTNPGGNGPSNPLDLVTGDCKAAPELESPGDGVPGWFDAGPAKAPAARAPSASYLYEQYGFAGLTWHTYDLGCGGAVRAPEASTDNWLANAVFGISKSWTAFTVSLREQATSDTDFLDDLDPVIERATRAVRDAVFKNWIGTSLVLLGALIIFQARKKDTAGVISQVGWALLVMTIATGVASYPVQASKFADDAMNTVISTIDQSFADVDLGGAPSDAGGMDTMQVTAAAAPDRTTAHGNMLVHHVLYQHWLRGALGDVDSDVAKKYGPQLLDAQALTWAQDRLPPAERQKVVAQKQKAFEDLAEKIKAEDPAAYNHLTGKKGDRLGQAGLSFLSAASANLFSTAADVIIVGAKLTIRFVVVLLPAIAVIGLHRRMAGTIKTGLHSIMAACINVPLFATAAAVDVLAVRTIMGNTGLPAWLKVLLLLLITWILWRIVKPLRRLSAMANPNRNWMEDAGSVVGTPGKIAKTLGKGYLVHRAMKRFGQSAGQAAGEEMSEALRDEREGLTGGSAGYDVDNGAWDGWANGKGPDAPNSPGGSGTRGKGSTVLASDTDSSLDAAYESDSGLDPHASPTGHDTRRHTVGAIGGGSRGIEADDVMDVDSWYVEDLDPAARDTRHGLPGGSSAPTNRGADDMGSLPAPSVPGSPGPLPGGSGGAAAVPSPRTRSEVPSPAPQSALPASENTQAAPPAAAAADRPYVEPQAPSVVPPTIDEDGNHVYVLYDPANDGFTVRDDRDGLDAPEEGDYR